MFSSPQFTLLFRIDTNGITNVSDFGLSEDVFCMQIFQTMGKNDSDKTVIKLPVKRMVLESLDDGLFSEKTDVVSILCLLVKLYNYIA